MIPNVKKMNLAASAILLAGLLSACASTPAEPDAEAARLHALMSVGAENGMRCLSVSQYDSVQILNEQMLLFKGTGNRVWANELRNRCPGMRKDDVLIFELRGSQVCSLDSVTPTRPGFLGWPHAGPKCSLGEFIEFDVDVLKAVGPPKL